MKIDYNGIIRDMTEEEIAQLQDSIPPISYDERVEARIRERYTIGQEFAIQRQRDTKPEEFAEYFAFVEQIKTEERGGA